MTANVKFSDGSVVEDTYMNESDESDISELYTWIRVLKNRQANLRYEIRDTLRAKVEYSDDYTLPESSDIVKYHNFLRNVSINGEAVGQIQATATNFKGDDYFSNHSLGDAIDVAPANKTEHLVEGKMSQEMNDRDKQVLKHFAVPHVPLTPDKEEMPLYVASNERNEGLHTFDKAKAMWDDFLSHIEVETDVSEPEESTNDEQESDSDEETDTVSVNDPTTVEGIGPATIEKLRDGGFDVTPTEERAEFAEPFEFESDDEEDTANGMPSAKEIIELQDNGWTKEEIKEMYAE